MTTCAHCGKTIKGKYVLTCPSNLAISLGIDSVKVYHVKCAALAGIKDIQ